MKMRIDISKLENKIANLINSSRSKIAKEEGYGIAIGLDILNAHLVSICERAQTIDDPIILCELLDCGVLIADNEEAEHIRLRAKEAE